ncbi:MAG TPA: transposase [Baekduia sp.]|nr:transposase [Baekduia sp.]
MKREKTIAEICREHDISETLLRAWREQFLAAGAERLQGKADRTVLDELRKQREDIATDGTSMTSGTARIREHAAAVRSEAAASARATSRSPDPTSSGTPT